MSNLKISQLPDGGSAQSTDQIPINRGGTNFRVNAGTIPSLVNFSDAETPDGSIDGSNTSFTLANVPNPAASLILVQDGVTLAPDGVGFTLSGADITTISAPFATLLAWYRF